MQGGIEIDRSDVGQDLLVQHLLEGLGLFFILLPVALQAVAQNLVKENAARPAGEDRRARIGIDQRRHAQGLQIVDHFPDSLEYGTIVRKTFGREGKERFVARQLHAVIRLCEGGDEQAVVGLRGLDF